MITLSAGVVVRLWNLGHQSFSMDEVWELQIAHAPWTDIHLIDDGFPPLFHYLLKVLLIMGSDMAGRWLAAAAGIATLYVVYRLGNALDRSAEPGLGLIAAAVLAWFPLHIHLAREGRVYSLAILGVAIAILGIWSISESASNHARPWLIYGSGLVLGMWLHYGLAVVALLGAGLTFFLSDDRKSWLTTHAVAGALALPILIPLGGDLVPHTTIVTARDAGLAEIGFLGKTLVFGFGLGPSARQLHVMSAGDAIAQLAPWIIVLVPAIGYLAWAGWDHLQERARRVLLVLIFGGLVLTTALISLSGIGFQVRYFAWLVVPISLWLAAGLARPGTGSTVAGLVLAVAALVSIGAREFSPEHQTEDARAVAAFVTEAEPLPGFALSWYMANPINYYLTPEAFLPIEDPRLASDVLGPRNKPGLAAIPLSNNVSGSQPDEILIGLIADSTDPGDRYYLFYSRPFHGDDDGSFLASLTEIDQLEQVFEAPGYRVFEGVRAN
ncbi:MAG: hypothetical protein KJO36_11935 [Acidimicrobiia bacterium]|nr:hypothetical protein [Acidimicrobiia bacterium]